MPASRRNGIAAGAAIAVGFAGLCLVYAMWVWSDDIGELGGDSAKYMLMARQFSPFYADSTVLAQSTQGSIYPPLFPFLIGLLGGGMLSAHLLVVACLCAAVWCLYRWLRLEGLGQILSAWTAAVFALMPGAYFLSLSIWTENLYLLLSLLALLAERKASVEDRPDPSLYWLAAAAVAAATLTRAAALPLLAAFILRLLLVRPPRWRVLVVASAIPFTVWASWTRLHQAGVSGYLAQWMDAYGQQPGTALKAQLSTELQKLGYCWVQAWLGKAGASKLLIWMVMGFGGLCLSACLWCFTARRFDAIYVVLYMTLLLAWPFPAEAARLGYVLLPVLLLQSVLAVQTAVSWRRQLIQAASALLLGMLTLALLPTLLITAQRFSAALPPELASARHTEPYYAAAPRLAMQEAHAYAGTLDLLRRAGQWVPEDDCIFAIKPSVVTLYSDRRSALPPASAVSEEEFGKGIGQCRFAYALAAVSPTFDQPLYPLGRLGQRAQVLQVASESNASGHTIFSELIAIDSDEPKR